MTRPRFRKVRFFDAGELRLAVVADSEIVGSITHEGESWAIRLDHLPGRVSWVLGPLREAKTEVREEIALVDAERINAGRRSA